MPLKHGHETRLIFLLGVVFIATGIMVSLLPPLPSGLGPWTVLFLLSVLYSVLLYPTFRRNRADNAFRKLHWFPALMLLFWLFLQGAMLLFDGVAAVSRIFAWGWSLPAVTVGFFLLFVFCLQVIRQRARRILLLALLFVPYAVMGFLAEQPQFTVNQRLAALLWDHAIWSVGSGQSGANLVAQNGSQSSAALNLDPSSDPGEERWREALRAFQRRMQGTVSFGSVETGATAGGSQSAAVSVGEQAVPQVPAFPPSLQRGGTGAHLREVASKPNGLPESGFGFGAFALTLVGGYCATLHARAKRRSGN
ncbi:MAG: hypothetical protein PHU04_03860 [Candidatus Peribacteraceae bacterium]|nr:hypothetical protein [Candidatus Peribacteraceae bacterium]